MRDPLRPTRADLDRWALDDELEAKAIARAAEPDITDDRD
jgi:hypothetical protein